MTYDYKRLCGELLNHLYQCDWPDGERFYALVERTRAALAEPEPEGPTDEELLCIAAKSIEPYDQILPGEYEPESNCAVEVYGSELVIYARAVLARWGK
jgi:hypothetical protein